MKDHLAHLALYDEIRDAEVARLSAGRASAWHMTGEQDATFNALGYDLRRHLPLDQMRWELATARQRLLQALAAATPAGPAASRYSEAGLRGAHEAAQAGWIKRWRQECGL